MYIYIIYMYIGERIVCAGEKGSYDQNIYYVCYIMCIYMGEYTCGERDTDTVTF